ncbi:MAG: helix-turn-helix domain-containing protein, partial [Euryarchaeota archaeon]|nr:helix-turn-helix domain-containing protein [Euryarchaeota archaeon]
MKKDTLLTKKQVEVLRLRAQGYSQTEIAKKFGTSRAN